MRHLLLCLALAVSFPSAACHPAPATSAEVQRGATVAFGAALAALEVLDEMQVQRLRNDQQPTLQKAWVERSHADQLERLRKALAIARRWLSGESSEAEGRQALRDATTILQLITDDLRARGIQIPIALDSALTTLAN